MLMKDQFRLLKNSNSEQNVRKSAKNSRVIELLQQFYQRNDNLKQVNKTKNKLRKM